MSPFWCLEFGGGSYIAQKFVDPCCTLFKSSHFLGDSSPLVMTKLFDAVHHLGQKKPTKLQRLNLSPSSSWNGKRGEPSW